MDPTYFRRCFILDGAGGEGGAHGEARSGGGLPELQLSVDVN